MAVIKVQEKQVKQLRINVTNINSFLIDSNKKLAKLRKQKELNNQRLEEKEKQKKEEANLEAANKNTEGGSLKKSIMKSSLSLFDKAKEFFGLLLTGIIVNELPNIVDGITTFIDNNAGWISGIGTFLMSIVKVASGLINLFKKDIPEIDSSVKEGNAALKELTTESSELDSMDEYLKNETKESEDEMSEDSESDNKENTTSETESQNTPPKKDWAKELTNEKQPAIQKEKKENPKGMGGGGEKPIVGRVGSTGLSTGPHVHIESGDGFDGRGKEIPEHIVNNVLINGKSIDEYELTSKPGPRNHPVTGEVSEHMGYDYAAPLGSAITLSGGLKVVEYSPGENNGYGNLLVIQDSFGKLYSLSHLQSGPQKTKKVKLDDKNLIRGKGGRDLSLLTNSTGKKSKTVIIATQKVETMVPYPQYIPVG